MQRIHLILACCLFAIGASGQVYPFVHYTPREGLVNNRVRFLYQDSRGRLYISTFGGLSIYDGVRFTNFTTDNGLVVSMINDIVEMGEDSVWIIPNTNRIHCIVNGRLKDFVPEDHFTPLINQLLKTADGRHYAIADEGLFLLQGRRFVKVPMPRLPTGDTVKSLTQAVEANRKLYILSNPDYKSPTASLLVYDLDREKLIAYNDRIEAMHLFVSPTSEVWISTWKGFFRMNRIYSEKDTVALSPFPASYHFPKDINPHHVYSDRQQQIWLATSKGVYRISRSGRVDVFTTDNGLTTNFQTSIYQDHENNIWFSNEQTGLCKLSNHQLAYYPEWKPGYRITDIFIRRSSDSVWIYDQDHHRTTLVLSNGKTEEYTNPGESLPFAGKIVSANGEWMLSGNTIYRWKASPGTGRYTLVPFYKDSTNKIGFAFGLADMQGNLATVSDKLVVRSGDHLATAPVHYMADHLAMDNKGRFWIAARSSNLFCYEVSGTGENAKLSLLRSYPGVVRGSPRSITTDRDGNVWIGTRDGGVYSLRMDGLEIRSIRQLTAMDGLSENFVNFLFCDRDNTIWACTPSGLDRISVVNNQFLVENVTRSNNLYLPVLKVQQAASGLLWILTSAGIITYNPARPAMTAWKPRLIISKAVHTKSGQVAIPPGHILSHGQNNLVFRLSAPSYIDEKQTRFSYLLEGSGNENWSTLSQDASIDLVNLPPGKYTLRARAVFLHGRYPDVEASYAFTVLPPWWQTWWFLLSIGVVLLVLALLGLRFYIRRRLERQRAVLEKKRAIELERTRIATDMHDDLGAGLSRIKFLSETIGMKKQQHLPIEEDINSIRTYSNEMIGKMGEIVWALNEKNNSLSDLLSYTRAYAVEYLEQNGIGCHFEEPEQIPAVDVNSEFRRNIYLTVKEALHNIVKHAQATQVDIDIDITDRLIIRIKDNGVGIGRDRTSPFGNGLFSMSTRIQHLKGRFGIVNENGTRVDITVPLDV